MKQKELIILDEIIISKIYFIRGLKVMLDSDLAELYRVETKQLKRQVRRNLNRFPKDFMFELSIQEIENLRSQFGTTSWGGSRYVPMVFTEQGVAMLSSVLNSDSAIEMNIHIIRIFTRLREMLLTHKDILLKLELLEKQVAKNNKEIQYIFEALKQLLATPSEPRKNIGFRKDE
jgi:hypothetical protein